jgi:hypothetical protein
MKTIQDIQKMLKKNNGRIKNVKLTENFYEFDDVSADPGMICDIIGCYPSKYDVGNSVILMDFEPYIDYNKSIASHDWRDKNSNSVLTWFETSYYKKEKGNEFYSADDFDLEEVFEFREFNPFTFKLLNDGRKIIVEAADLSEAKSRLIDLLIELGYIEVK